MKKKFLGTRKRLVVKNLLILAGIALILVSMFMLSYWIVLNPDIQENRGGLTEPSSPDYKILFLDSYSPTHSSYGSQEMGLKEGLYSNGISYDVIYMDTKNYGAPEHVADFYDFFKKRMDSRSVMYDGVIVGDDAALSFALKYQDEFFEGLPVVFYGINNIALANIATGNPFFTGFSEETYLGSTIDLAIELLPHAKKIVGIYDDTATGKGDMASFFRCKKDYDGYEFLGINTSMLTRKEFERQLEALDNDVILIYLTAFTDVDGNNYTIPQSVRTIVDHTHIPVFRNYSEGQGDGILGGTMMNFPEQCRMAGETMSSILRGEKKVSDIPLYTKTSGIVAYDYELMKQYNLDPSKLPAETVFYNRPVNYFKESAHIIFPIMFIALGFVFVLAGLIVNTFIMKSADEQLKFEATHDSLTGLHNNRAAEDYLNEMLCSGKRGSMVRLDVDNFKTLNESYGHSAGDYYLKYLGAMIERKAREINCFAARYSGDEFIFIVPGKQLDRDSDFVKELQSICRIPMVIGLEQVSMSASIGIANSGDGATVEKLFLQSGIALAAAKEYGRNTTMLFSTEFEERAKNSNAVRQSLVDAIDNDGFYLVYQPKVDALTKNVVGYEALLRMKEGGTGPGDFIPVAEQSGLICRIGRIVTESVVRQLSIWKKEGRELKNVSMNFSANQVVDTGYVDFLKELLDRYEVEPRYIGLEITEGLFMDNTWQAGSLFSRLRDIGVQLLMDGFGTGCSSLNYLTYMPADIIKLDKSFVNAYMTDGKDVFIRDVINLTHDIGKKIVIGGVEEEWQYERLNEFGADYIQGYYFSKPLSSDDAINFMVAEKI